MGKPSRGFSYNSELAYKGLSGDLSRHRGLSPANVKTFIDRGNFAATIQSKLTPKTTRVFRSVLKGKPPVYANEPSSVGMNDAARKTVEFR